VNPAGDLGRIHHVGYVVADLDAGLATLARSFALTVTVREVMDAQGVEALMAEGAGGGAIELIRPLDPEGAIARFMAARGEGFHHVAFAVPDVDAALARLAAGGSEVIDARGRRGLGGHRVGFLHPRSTLGVLTELVQAEHIGDG
jgi:methylmalonyl-CoA/ethylmalonyl-CoA epimerase